MYRVIFMQLAATLVAVIGSSLYVGLRGGVSAAIGGLVYVIPNLLFAFFYFRIYVKRAVNIVGLFPIDKSQIILLKFIEHLGIMIENYSILFATIKHCVLKMGFSLYRSSHKV